MLSQLKIKTPSRKVIFSASDPERVAEKCREIFKKRGSLEFQEEVIILCLNSANLCFGYAHISTGGIASSVIDPRVVFSIALTAGASAIILAHNHPSGNILPSTEDRLITERIQQAGELLHLRLIDHLIITKQGYKSLIH